MFFQVSGVAVGFAQLVNGKIGQVFVQVVAFFIIYLRQHIRQQDAGKSFVPAQFVVNILYDVRHNVVLVNKHLKTLRQFQVSGKSADNLVDKRVDGAHRKFIVMMRDIVKQALGLCDEFFFRKTGFGHKFLKAVVSKMTCHDFGQVFQNPGFHFVGRFVGEGDSQDMPEIFRVLQRKLQVFFYQGSGFTGTGRRPVHHKILVHFISLFLFFSAFSFCGTSRPNC